MKKLKFILFFIFYFGLCITVLHAQTEQVNNVTDDYTLILSSGKKVRLIGIDIPKEFPQQNIIDSFYRLSQHFTKNLLQGKNIRLEFDTYKEDNKGRLLAYVYLADGTLVNEEIIKQGFASAVKNASNRKYINRLLNAEQEAKNNNKGFWQILSYVKGETDFKDLINLSQIPDGSYTGSDSTILGEVSVRVEIKNSKVAKIDILKNTYSHCNEINRAFSNVPLQIISKQSIDVDTVSGATVSSQGIKLAVVDALSKAE